MTRPNWKTSVPIGALLLLLVGWVFTLFFASANKVDVDKFDESVKVNAIDHSEFKDDIHEIDKKVDIYASKQEAIIKSVDKIDGKIDKVLEKIES